MPPKELSCEELFAPVWEKPTREVARGSCAVIHFCDAAASATVGRS